MRATWIILVTLAGLLSPAAVTAKSLLFVSVAGEQRIAVYGRNPTSGGLTFLHETPIHGEPGALAVNPAHTVLFASIRSTGHLTSFRIDPSTGQLHSVSELAAGADPAYVSVHASGEFLFSAYYRAAKVMVHRILPDGSMKRAPIQEIPTADKAHAIVTDRSNRFVFVPHTGPNSIFQFRLDSDTGTLRPGPIPQVKRPPNTGPRHLSFHPSLDFAYVSDEQGSSISVYRFDPELGQLEAIQVASTLPAGFEERNSTAHLEVHPSGQFVYVANRGHDSLAIFQIDQQTGRVTSLGQVATEATPRSFHCSADGAHLYAAGQSSGKLAVFDVDLSSGGLSRQSTYKVGDRPWWVLAVDTP